MDTVALSFDDGYRVPIERVAAALNPQTRLVSLASPQNPSGVRASASDIAALLEAVAERAPSAGLRDTHDGPLAALLTRGG